MISSIIQKWRKPPSVAVPETSTNEKEVLIYGIATFETKKWRDTLHLFSDTRQIWNMLVDEIGPNKYESIEKMRDAAILKMSFLKASNAQMLQRPSYVHQNTVEDFVHAYKMAEHFSGRPFQHRSAQGFQFMNITPPEKMMADFIRGSAVDIGHYVTDVAVNWKAPLPSRIRRVNLLTHVGNAPLIMVTGE